MHPPMAGGTGKGGKGAPSAKQKASRARFAAMMKGRGGGAKRSTGSKSLAKPSASRSHGTTLATTYRGLVVGTVIAGPAVVVAETYERTPGPQPIGRDTVQEVWAQYKADAKPLAMGVVTLAASDTLGQKVFQHNTALGRGSITAWAAELIPAGRAALVASQSGGVAGAKALSAGKSGYTPGSGWDFGATKDHQVAKLVAGVIRKASNMPVFRPVAVPLKRGIASMGGAL
jgi:hypothetical protein